jgi:hypothetical protein
MTPASQLNVPVSGQMSLPMPAPLMKNVPVEEVNFAVG